MLTSNVHNSIDCLFFTKASEVYERRPKESNDGRSEKKQAVQFWRRLCGIISVPAQSSIQLIQFTARIKNNHGSFTSFKDVILIICVHILPFMQ